MIEIVGYIGALLVGVILGLIGGGGSILTVPIMVYFFYLDPVVATAYSLFVVGTTALIGAVRNMFKKMVDFRTAIIFATPAFISVFITRRYLIPAIPQTLFYVGDYAITKGIAIMLFFSIVMVLVAITMIRNKRPEPEAGISVSYNYPIIVIQGIGLGLITGAIGAGGGFLIIPVLVLLAKLPIKKAIATSLLIIAINSLIGFTGDIATLEIDWPFLLSFTALSIIGIFIGIRLNHFINGKKLKQGFGWFVLLMGIYIILNEIVN
ncbi:sulfite exporter TauE/SafE family protein [Aequorivita echinoideorum]|uniref:Probable membrane transporter protein n=1 Tax=Aequorivita echinoideorum TaxID=1549647 RepID=A0ABS5S9U5_9FLAO|nr:sulfite exporter TauE/SafE family protein [Aequorivita echinoideorum]MBT0609194.1 sulfite exporter TauE/SafE family protein [Aequorivita echinoideorum]